MPSKNVKHALVLKPVFQRERVLLAAALDVSDTVDTPVND